MFHLTLALVWSIVTMMLLLWKNVPQANLPDNINTMAGVAGFLAAYNFLRWALSLGRYLRKAKPTPPESPPPAPRVANPEFDFTEKSNEISRGK